MSYLIFDTETSNLPQKSLSLDHPDQCRVLQLAAILVDEEFAEVNSFCTLIDIPENVNISPGAASKHGITREQCKSYGVGIQRALSILEDFSKKSTVIVGHNVKFDIERVNDELALLGILYNNFTEQGSIYCTMLGMTNECKLVGKYPGKFKWPKLTEAYKHCYNADFSNAHDALADVRATAKVLAWLKTRGKFGTQVQPDIKVLG